MTAVVLAPSFDLMTPVWSLGVLIALGVLVAQLGAHWPKKAKRIIGAAAIAASLSVAVVRAEDLVILNPCKNLTPADAMWWVLGCFWPL